MQEKILNEIEEIRTQLQSWRRELHKIPEVGLELPKTRTFVLEKLEEFGVSYETFEHHSGVVAVLGTKDTACVGIRADMDALYIQEENSVSYMSQHPGMMHACGHDAHTAILLGIAKVLKNNESSIPGKIKLIFQPAEEMPPGGAIVMCQDGVLENPKVDAVLGLHMDRLIEGAKVGDFTLKTGSIMGADDVIKLKIFGKGGHASEPERAIDPILIACNCVNQLHQIVGRYVNPNKAAVLSITDFHAGSGTDNVIPEEASLMGTLRNSDEETREIIKDRIREVVQGTVTAMGGTYELELMPDYPVLFNNKKLTSVVSDAIVRMYGDSAITVLSSCSMGGDDFAFFSREVPGCYFTLVADKEATDGIVYPAHHPKFDLDDTILDRGAVILIKSAFDYLSLLNN